MTAFSYHHQTLSKQQSSGAPSSFALFSEPNTSSVLKRSMYIDSPLCNQPSQTLSLLSSVSKITAASFHVRKFTRTAETPEYPPVCLHTIKTFLLKKRIEFRETHPCVVVQVPKYIIKSVGKTESSSETIKVCDVHINKITGSFVCPELAAAGNWNEIKAILNIWNHNVNCKKKA